jgi:hypothetical protein
MGLADYQQEGLGDDAGLWEQMTKIGLLFYVNARRCDAEVFYATVFHFWYELAPFFSECSNSKPNTVDKSYLRKNVVSITQP